MENESIDLVSLFGEEFEIKEQPVYDQFKIKTDYEMFRYLKQFIILEEEPVTRYKHKLGYYKKKGHYINGKKVNRQVYKYVKTWLEKNI